MEKLSIAEFYGAEALSVITQRCSISLRKLKLILPDSLTMRLSMSQVDLSKLVHELQQPCSNLCGLTLALPRYRSDGQVALYRTLGGLKFLTYLSIMFECFDQLQ
ncbi:hypothetical protein E8E14_013751 [Neopestalotiopsis sp. 37M]|nr:hypothetical protein E8E14_013751 [Neopestalotiopsis sp. 37M]